MCGLCGCGGGDYCRSEGLARGVVVVCGCVTWTLAGKEILLDSC